MSRWLVRLGFSLAAVTAASATALAQNGATAAVATFAEPGISPDHSEIAFASGGDIWTVPTAGGVARLLVSHPANESRPLYSPDGKRLAFISTRSGNGDVYVLTFANGDLERLTFDDAPDQLDSWSPDGKWVYFSSSSREIAGMNDVFRVSAEGGTPMPVSADRYTNEYWAAPAPNGGAIAITDAGHDVRPMVAARPKPPRRVRDLDSARPAGDAVRARERRQVEGHMADVDAGWAHALLRLGQGRAAEHREACCRWRGRRRSRGSRLVECCGRRSRPMGG